MSDKIVRRNCIMLGSVTIGTIIITAILMKSDIISITMINKLGKDFQYNLLSFSGVLAGFLFTGVGILISAIDKERIKRLWYNRYLDNLYHCAALGILCSIFTILTVFSELFCTFSKEIQKKILEFQVLFIILGMVYFIWCTYMLIGFISKMRKEI